MSIIVELVKIGFHGLAIAMAILTYRLIHKAMVINTESESHSKKFSELIGLIKLFMLLSMLLFIIGVFAQIFSTYNKKEVIKAPNANVFMSPVHWPANVSKYEEYLTVNHETSVVEFNEGYAVLKELENKDTIRIILDELVKAMSETEYNNLELRNSLIINNTPGNGFGDQ